MELNDKAKELIKELNGDLIKELREKAIQSDAVHAQAIEKLSNRVTDAVKELDEVNVKLKASTFTHGSDKADKMEQDYIAAVNKMFVAKNTGANTASEAQLIAEYNKAYNTVTPADGSFMVPKSVAANIDVFLAGAVPLMGLAGVVETSLADYTVAAKTSRFGIRKQTEGSAAATQSSGVSAEVRIPLYNMDTQIAVTQQYLQDTAFNVVNHVSDQIEEDFAAFLNTWFIAGTGTAEPTGLMTAAVTSPSNVLTQIKKVQAVAGAGVGAFKFDDLIKLQGSMVTTSKLSTSAWIFGYNHFANLLTLKDNNNNYLMGPALTVAGAPLSILGSPIYFSDDFTAQAANIPVAFFGDFKKAVKIVKKQAADLAIVDNLTAKPDMLYYYMRRYGFSVSDGRYAVCLGGAAS